eukprot:7638649-Alexandrium_andersonii.AAC.1
MNAVPDESYVQARISVSRMERDTEAYEQCCHVEMESMLIKVGAEKHLTEEITEQAIHGMMYCWEGWVCSGEHLVEGDTETNRHMRYD